tara:strand:- start:2493 stop:2963 length:471 start_codon:yes stop_codon:yes gene_type:complete
LLAQERDFDLVGADRDVVASGNGIARCFVAFTEYLDLFAHRAQVPIVRRDRRFKFRESFDECVTPSRQCLPQAFGFELAAHETARKRFLAGGETHIEFRVEIREAAVETGLLLRDTLQFRARAAYFRAHSREFLFHVAHGLFQENFRLFEAIENRM